MIGFIPGDAHSGLHPYVPMSMYYTNCVEGGGEPDDIYCQLSGGYEQPWHQATMDYCAIASGNLKF